MNFTIGLDTGNRGRRFSFQLPNHGSASPAGSHAPFQEREAPREADDALRIAHVTPYDLAVSGGVNATVRQLVNRQRRMGHTVDVIGGASTEVLAVPHWRKIRASVLSMPANGSMAALCLPMAPEEGGDIDQVLKQGQYDVLVLHEPALPLCALTLRLSTSANVGTVHAYSETLRPPARLVRLLVPPLERVHRWIAVSDAARSQAMSYLDVPYAVVPNGIDEASSPSCVARSSAEVLFVGRPEPRKGLDVLLRAMPLLRAQVPDAQLVIAGDGSAEDWAVYRALASQLGIIEAVSFRGRVSDAQKQQLFEHATVFCSPASGGESQGVVLLEALAHGTPVVATDIAGYRTVIRSEVNGLLVEAGRAHHLADGLRRILQDPDLATRLAAAGRQTVKDTYAWSTVIPRLMAEYRAAVDDSSPRGELAHTRQQLLTQERRDSPR